MLAFVPPFSGIFCSGSKELKNKQKKTNKFVKYVSQQASRGLELDSTTIIDAFWMVFLPHFAGEGS